MREYSCAFLLGLLSLLIFLVSLIFQSFLRSRLSGRISYFSFTVYLVTIIFALHYMRALQGLERSEFLAGRNHEDVTVAALLFPYRRCVAGRKQTYPLYMV